jgi:alkylated DNA repair dioxygenase AlkB
MVRQFNFFESLREEAESSSVSLEGFKYRAEVIDAREENDLIARVRGLPFEEFDFHGFKGKRRVVSFGWRYNYSGGGLQEAEDIPSFLLDLRMRAASFGELEPDTLQQVLVTEYRPGSGIGWHRDRSVFGQVVGISLLAPCVLRFRRSIGEKNSQRRPKAWERMNVLAEPRSGYLLSGTARAEWEHSILRVDELRYAITFRQLRNALKT